MWHGYCIQIMSYLFTSTVWCYISYPFTSITEVLVLHRSTDLDFAIYYLETNAKTHIQEARPSLK